MGSKETEGLEVLVVYGVWLVLSISGGIVMGTSWILKSVDFGGVDCYETIIDITGI